ncbi:hypothetical protein MTO96_041596 [Rhipicephalus appendiculatus]
MATPARSAVPARLPSRSPEDKSAAVPATPCNSPRQAAHTPVEPAADPAVVALHGSPGSHCPAIEPHTRRRPQVAHTLRCAGSRTEGDLWTPTRRASTSS